MFFKKKDIMGDALLDYLNGNKNAQVILHSNSKVNNMYTINGREVIQVSDFYNIIDNLTEADKQALNQCYGKVLDIGAAAGSHSMILMNRGIDIYSLDISPKAVEVMKKRGLKKVYCDDIHKFKPTQFDTLVFFGNNHGLFGSIENLEKFLLNISNLLKSDGQILISSPYVKIPMNNYGSSYYTQYIELKMNLEYNGYKSKDFKWFMIEPSYLRDYFRKYNWEINTNYYDEKKTCLIKFRNLHN